MSEVVRESLKTAVKGTAFVFSGSIAGILLWFASKVLIIRSTTKEEFGIYSLAIAVASIVALIANAGIQDGVTRFISIFLGEGKKKDAEAVSKASLQISLATGLTASVGLYLLAPHIARYIFYMPDLSTPLRVISFFCLFQVLANVLIGVLRGYGLISPRVYYINIGHPLFFLLFLGTFIALKLSYISIIYAFLFSIILVYASIGLYGYSKIRLNPLSISGGKFRRELLSFSIPLIGITLLNMVFAWTDTFMLGRYTGAEEVGIYNVSMSLAKLLGFALISLNFVFMPIVGEMYSKRQMADINRTYQVLTKWVFAATLPMFFILFFFPEMTVTFLFEQRYIASSGPLRLLAAGFLSTVFAGASMVILIVFGMTRQIFNIALFATALNVLLNYVFIKRLGYGVMGASVATMISMIASTLLRALLLYLRTGMHPLTAKYLRPVLGSAIIGLIIYVVAKNLPLHFWMLPVYFLLFIVGYLFSLFITGSLEREDVALFDAVSAKTGCEMRLIRKLIHRVMPKDD